MRHLVLLAALAALTSGCGGGQASSGTTADEVDDTSVADDGATEEEQPEATPEEPAATGPGRLRVVNRVGGEDASGSVRVLDASGETVAEGASGDTFTVEAGSYRVVGEITDPSVLIDTPTRESDGMITVVAGQEQTVTVDHPVSRVRLRVSRAGRPVARWTMEVRRQGEEGEAIRLQSGNDYTPITPGRYDGTLQFGSNRIEVTGIIFQGGARMDVPVNVD
ncbi:MAG: hypothetical protein M5U28_53715 [Sandaracinaceae bacterium]|nr:hypothetical protein [Sandaracinaceae bacterium]